jgi:hypothetical protein
MTTSSPRTAGHRQPERTTVNLVRTHRNQTEESVEYSADFGKLFVEDMTRLYLLSYFLTANHEMAERCFVCGFGDCIQGKPGVSEVGSLLESPNDHPQCNSDDVTASRLHSDLGHRSSGRRGRAPKNTGREYRNRQRPLTRHLRTICICPVRTRALPRPGLLRVPGLFAKRRSRRAGTRVPSTRGLRTENRSAAPRSFKRGVSRR